MKTIHNYQFGNKQICRILSILLCLWAFTLTIHAESMLSSPEGESPLHISSMNKAGDVNNDGELSLSDVLLIVDYILGNPSSDFNKDNADLDGDGEISLADILILIDHILNPEDDSTPKPDDGDANPYLPVLSPRHY